MARRPGRPRASARRPSDRARRGRGAQNASVTRLLLPPVEACRCRRARAGFLTAVAELIDLAVTGVNRRTDTRELLRPRVRVLCSGRVRTRSTCEKWSLCEPTYDGRASFRPFGRRSRSAPLATDARTRFEITSGSDGDLAGVPVAISWQPRVVAACRAQPRIEIAHPSEEKSRWTGTRSQLAARSGRTGVQRRTERQEKRRRRSPGA